MLSWLYETACVFSPAIQCNMPAADTCSRKTLGLSKQRSKTWPWSLRINGSPTNKIVSNSFKIIYIRKEKKNYFKYVICCDLDTCWYHFVSWSEMLDNKVHIHSICLRICILRLFFAATKHLWRILISAYTTKC